MTKRQNKLECLSQETLTSILLWLHVLISESVLIFLKDEKSFIFGNLCQCLKAFTLRKRQSKLECLYITNLPRLGLFLRVRPEPIGVEHLWGTHLDVPTNIKLVKMARKGPNTLAYLAT
jgi:hypothetical protein